MFYLVLIGNNGVLVWVELYNHVSVIIYFIILFTIFVVLW